MNNVYLLKRILTVVSSCFIMMACVPGCVKDKTTPENPVMDRHLKLPAEIVKRNADSDHHPPVLHSPDYEQPVALGNGINTSGAEDSPFILPDGKTLYFFFTPDVRIAPEKQLLDSVTGIWVSHKTSGVWSDAKRVWLQDPGKLALDGAAAIQGDEMWFASAREGFTGVNMFIARSADGKWKDWEYAGDRLMKEIQIGEVHLHRDELYFHSARAGGLGHYDIWSAKREGSNWLDPVHVSEVNSPEMDGYPFLTADGKELWFCRNYAGTPAIYRSIRQNGLWGAPELIISQFAGEPTLDDEGNIYFVHHFFENNVMIEADIYVAYRKK